MYIYTAREKAGVKPERTGLQVKTGLEAVRGIFGVIMRPILSLKHTQSSKTHAPALRAEGFDTILKDKDLMTFFRVKLISFDERFSHR